jgi:hypothetical protein
MKYYLILVFWVLIPYSLVDGCNLFDGTYSFTLQGTEAWRHFERLIFICQTARCPLGRPQCEFVLLKVKLSLSNHGDLEGGWNVGLWTLFGHSAQLGRFCFLAIRAVRFYSQGNSFVLISVRGWVEFRAAECQQGLGHVKISRNPTGNRTWYFPCCGAVPPSVLLLSSNWISVFVLRHWKCKKRNPY